MKTVYIDTASIHDHPSFHSAFAQAFGFPAFYGANMDAWIDCMRYLGDSEAGMSRVTINPGEVLLLELSDSIELAARCPDIWEDLIDAVVFVNQYYLDENVGIVLAQHLR